MRGDSVEVLPLLLPSTFSDFVAASSAALADFLPALLVDVEIIDPHVHVDVDDRSSLQPLPYHLLQPPILDICLLAGSHEGVGLDSAGLSF